jgi:hypothetical protein
MACFTQKGCRSETDVVKNLAKKETYNNTTKEVLSFLFSFEMLSRYKENTTLC